MLGITKMLCEVQCRSQQPQQRQSQPVDYGGAAVPTRYSTIQGCLSKAVVCQSNVTALSREAALFIPGYELISPTPQVVPSDFDHLISGYRLIEGSLLYR